jgi:hypothetical protein
MQSALGEAERKLVNCQLELRAALDKLDVYRRTEGVSSGGTVKSSTSGSTYTPGHLVGGEGAGGGAAVDEGKSAEELRAELRQLREVLQLETADAAKVRRGWPVWPGGLRGHGVITSNCIQACLVCMLYPSCPGLPTSVAVCAWLQFPPASWPQPHLSPTPVYSHIY